MLIDFHSHTTLSDGTLTAEEMVAAAERRGYEAYAITDHARGDDIAYRDIVAEVRAQVDRLRTQTRIHLFAGVELTDFDPELIPRAAEEVRRLGAQVVVVHGECTTLEVSPGTNAAAVRSPGVDILAHPGLITERDADEATRHGIYLELSARQGHCWSNGHVYQTARKAGASLIVDSDAHEEAGLLSVPKVAALVRGAGASELSLNQIVNQMAPVILNKLLRRYAPVH
ncbi:MAG TPA: histidinol phosphate phosphatase domain-containing protein [Chloroflexota bacterium]